uniref:Uncharacterized protein n=1 Tax=Aegilops tauschii subsp. strangulata TaxID=200361 RepID=A0A453NSY8_AEGTS
PCDSEYSTRSVLSAPFPPDSVQYAAGRRSSPPVRRRGRSGRRCWTAWRRTTTSSGCAAGSARASPARYTRLTGGAAGFCSTATPNPLLPDLAPPPTRAHPLLGWMPIGATWPDAARARASTWSPRAGQGSWAQRAAHGGLGRRGWGRAHAEAGLAPQHLHNKCASRAIFGEAVATGSTWWRLMRRHR